MNTFGTLFRLTSFGESHGPAMGGVIDGCPPGLKIDFDLMRHMLERRCPGTSTTVSARKETDSPEFLSGLSSDGIALGSPIAFIIRNKDARPSDYDAMAHLYRPNHADYTYDCRYGIRDPRGGGRSSARDTVSWVVAGAVALSYLHTLGIEVKASLIDVGGTRASGSELMACIEETRRNGDSVGGVVECIAIGVPPGIGNPNADKLHAAIAMALMSINGVKGVEYGDGFAAAASTGSEQADVFIPGDDGIPGCATNHSGGIQGGISNGMPIVFRVAFKPTPTIARPLSTIDNMGRPAEIHAKGRHDPCIAVRGTVVVEAMMALAIADSYLASRR